MCLQGHERWDLEPLGDGTAAHSSRAGITFQTAIARLLFLPFIPFN